MVMVFRSQTEPNRTAATIKLDLPRQPGSMRFQTITPSTDMPSKEKEMAGKIEGRGQGGERGGEIEEIEEER